MSTDPPPSPELSTPITRLAWAIERACRTPGRYLITLIIPDSPRAPLSAEISRVEPVQQLELEKKPPPEHAP